MITKDGKTTKKHFEVFEREVWKWVRRFGLLDWDVVVEHMELENENSSAECAYNMEAKSATIRLNTTFTVDDQPFRTRELKESAFHEVCELLLCPLGYLAESRYTTYEQIQTVRHGIVQRLLNGLFRETSKGARGERSK